MNNAERIKAIEQRLQEAFHPSKIEVINESHLHAGHEGAKTGRGHFALTISATTLESKSRVEQHRLIYAALGDLMQNEIHALRIKVSD